jgi:adenosylmethionine-8-amino-7-oxononanoate aminotransferase
MLASVEFANPGSLDPVGGRPMAFTGAVVGRCWEEGLIIRALWENVSLAPPLCTTPAQVDEMIDIVRKAVESVTRKYI